MKKTLVPALSLVLFAAACSDGDGPSGSDAPDVEGSYTATWTARISTPGLPGGLTVSCPGTVVVASQSGEDFSGSFTVAETEQCEPVTNGVVAGEVQANGSLTLELSIPGADPDQFANLTGCTLVSGDNTFDGHYAGGKITATASAVLDCETGNGTRRVNVTLDLSAQKT